jgi:hypothetical protein
MHRGGVFGGDGPGGRRYAIGAVVLLALAGCHGSAPVSCDQVPTTADGCRELCHDRGAEMTFFRWAPGTYRCDATCECGDGTSR